VSGVTTFSPFGLTSGTPTAITLSGFSAHALTGLDTRTFGIALLMCGAVGLFGLAMLKSARRKLPERR